jgi:hypothetical protein
VIKYRLWVRFQNKAVALTKSLRIISKTEESAAEQIDCQDLRHYCFDCHGLLLCQFVGRCQKSSNVEEMTEILLGTQLVSLPQQHLHAHFAFHPEVSHEKQTSLVPQPHDSPELCPTSFFLFSERMFT